MHLNTFQNILILSIAVMRRKNVEFFDFNQIVYFKATLLEAS